MLKNISNFLKNIIIYQKEFYTTMPLNFTHTSQSFLDTLCTDKLYELRLLKTHPRYNSEFLKLAEKCIPLKKNVAKLIGFWNTEFGSLNTSVQLWEYDSYKDHLLSWEKLQKEGNWDSSFVEKAFPMIVKEENMTLRRITNEPLMITGNGSLNNSSYYRMNTYIIKPPMLDNIVKFKELTAKYNKEFADANIKCVNHIATFLPDSDKMSKLIELVRYENMDDIQLYKKRQELTSLGNQIKDVAHLVQSEILVPASFSPMK